MNGYWYQEMLSSICLDPNSKGECITMYICIVCINYCNMVNFRVKNFSCMLFITLDNTCLIDLSHDHY